MQVSLQPVKTVKVVRSKVNFPTQTNELVILKHPLQTVRLRFIMNVFLETHMYNIKCTNILAGHRRAQNEIFKGSHKLLTIVCLGTYYIAPVIHMK